MQPGRIEVTWITALILVKEYYDKLIASQGKESILFKHSAHGKLWDQP